MKNSGLSGKSIFTYGSSILAVISVQSVLFSELPFLAVLGMVLMGPFLIAFLSTVSDKAYGEVVDASHYYVNSALFAMGFSFVIFMIRAFQDGIDYLVVLTISLIVLVSLIFISRFFYSISFRRDISVIEDQHLSDMLRPVLKGHKLKKSVNVFRISHSSERLKIKVSSIRTNRGGIHIFVGDKISEILSEDEMLAVLLHEVGHFTTSLRSKLGLLKAVIISAYFISFVFIIYRSSVTSDQLISGILLLITILMLVGLFRLSRLFRKLEEKEQLQADFFAIESMGGKTHLLSALDKIYDLESNEFSKTTAGMFLSSRERGDIDFRKAEIDKRY